MESGENQVYTGPYLQYGGGGGGKNNTTKFFLWQGFRFLEITFHKAIHDYSAVIVEIPRHSLFCKQSGTLNPMYTILTVYTVQKKK